MWQERALAAPPRITPDDMHRLGQLLRSHPWQFARTMPDNPHHYTLVKTWPRPSEFFWCVETMRAHGYEEWYGGKPYVMFNVNEHKYWTMGAVVRETILINRKALAPGVEPPAHYDALAADYDAAFSDPESLAENEAVMSLIGGDDSVPPSIGSSAIDALTILDIGCGTGLFLDYFQPRGYTGIDPSFAMLEHLRIKHPGYADRVLPTGLERFAGAEVSYDLLLCLFGSAAYIDPDHLRAATRFLRPGGRYVVMFMEDGYVPVTYERLGVKDRPVYRTGITTDFPGTNETTTIGHYLVVDGRIPDGDD